MILIQITMEVIIIIILYSCHNKLKCFIFLFFHLDQLSYDWCQHFWFYSIRFNFISFVLFYWFHYDHSVLFMISEMVKQEKENNVFVKKYENNDELMWRLKKKWKRKSDWLQSKKKTKMMLYQSQLSFLLFIIFLIIYCFSARDSLADLGPNSGIYFIISSFIFSFLQKLFVCSCSIQCKQSVEEYNTK